MPRSYRCALVLSVALLAAVTGCTDQPDAPPPAAPPVSGGAPTPGPVAPTAVAAPPVTPGELSRTVWTAGGRMDRTIRAKAHAGREYALDAACVSTTPGHAIRYELRSATATANTPVASGDLPCDGGTVRDSSPLPATAVQIDLGPDLTGVTSAWAVLRPVT
ncbi:hypothetical protein ABZS44_22320 [Micromonospora sediminicola]|uniref:hypothetical protein n=1 Tax=Micromonospora sediminicola TaxID=946078 RepID=UPI0033ACD963